MTSNSIRSRSLIHRLGICGVYAFLLCASRPSEAKIEKVVVKGHSGSVAITGSSTLFKVVGRGRMVESGNVVTVKAENLKDDISLTVPDKVELDVRTISGDITISKMTGYIRCKTISGKIHIQTAKKGAWVWSVSGDITIQEVQGKLYAKTVSGDIGLKGKMSQAKVTSISGDIDLYGIDGSVKANSTSGYIKFEGALHKGSNIIVHSHSGDIAGTLKAQDGVNYSLHTFSGDLSIHKGSESIQCKESQCKGAIGKGGAEMKLNTFSGDINILIKT